MSSCHVLNHRTSVKVITQRVFCGEADVKQTESGSKSLVNHKILFLEFADTECLREGFTILVEITQLSTRWIQA